MPRDQWAGHISDKDLAEWQAAIEEYEEQHGPARPRKGEQAGQPRFPIGTVAFYGPDDRTTTKVAAAVIPHEGAEPVLARWVGTDVATSPKVQQELRHVCVILELLELCLELLDLGKRRRRENLEPQRFQGCAVPSTGWSKRQKGQVSSLSLSRHVSSPSICFFRPVGGAVATSKVPTACLGSCGR